MKSEKDIKIFVTYKDKHKIIETDIIKPIQTGRAIADEAFEGMIGDDTGENISAENPYYAELSAQYWAWKNYDKIGNPDYIGFMHYRRHFIFNEQYKSEMDDKKSQFGYSAYVFKSITDEYLSQIHLDDQHIKETVKDTDIIFIKKANAKYLNCKNGREDFSKNCYGSHPEDYDKCMQLIEKLHPDYAEEIAELNKGPYRYFYNMFIMKKDEFFEYSQFLFPILDEFKKQVDIKNYSQKASRVLGYMGEFILSLYAFKKHKDSTKNIKELYSSFILDTKENVEINPAFETNNNVIAMSSSNEYVPYLSTCLESLKSVADKNQNYDIIIFERSITEKNKQILKKQIERENISLRFVNPMNILTNYDLQFPKHYNLECYFRLTSPLILKNFGKVLFTDVDLLFLKDPSIIYNEDITNYPLAACQDLIMNAFVNNTSDSLNWAKYLRETLELVDIYKYFNTGVMLINIKYFNENNLSRKILELVAKNQYRILEQDGLNAFFKTNIKYIDTAWNFPVANIYYEAILCLMPQYCLSKYEKDAADPNIMHFAGRPKPWYAPEENRAHVWWSYARKTPFYEEILKRMTMSGIALPPPPKCLSHQRLRPVLEIQNSSKLCYGRNQKPLLPQKTHLQRQNQSPKIIYLFPYILRAQNLSSA